VVKRKYQILKTSSEFWIDTQTQIVLACVALHNWVRSKEGEKAYILVETEKPRPGTDIQPLVIYPVDAITSNRMVTFRDELVEKMWVDYQDYLRNNKV
jgi:hypothetical protein